MIHFGAAFSLSFEDSEIWGITSSQRIFQIGQLWNSAWFKPMFSLLLGSVTQIAPDNWSTLTLSRALSWLFSVSLIFSLSRLLSERYRGPLLILTILSPVVVLNLTKVRSDLYSVAVALLTLQWILLSELSQRKRIFIFFLGSTATLLLTPKSIDLYLLLVFALFQPWPTSPTLLRQTLIAVISPISGALVPLLFFSPETLFRLVRYASDSYKSSDFFATQNWLYFYDMIRTAPILAATVAIGLASATWNYRRLSWQLRPLLWGAVASLCYTLLAPQKLPFLLSSRLPIWVLGASAGLQFCSFKSLRQQQIVGVLAVIIALGVSTVLWIRSPFQHFEMSIQHEAYIRLDRSLAELNPTSYWDAIGLFPKRNRLFHYPSPGDSSNEEVFQAIIDSNPSLILQMSKTKLLGPVFEEWLRTHYAETGTNIWIRRSTIEPSANCQWPSTLLLEQAIQAGLRPPLALVTSNPLEDLFVRKWIRIPFHFANGAEADSLSEALPWSVAATDCEKALALTEAAPWTLSDAPNFSALFGFRGLL